MKRKLWLCLPGFLFGLLDAALTLHGQPDPYWQGDYSYPLELNPAGAWLLRYHPLIFALGVSCWLLAFSAFVLCLPPRPAFWAALLLALGHGLGVVSWLAHLGPAGVVLAILFLAAAERLFRYSWRMSGGGGAKPSPDRKTGEMGLGRGEG